MSKPPKSQLQFDHPIEYAMIEAAVGFSGRDDPPDCVMWGPGGIRDEVNGATPMCSFAVGLNVEDCNDPHVWYWYERDMPGMVFWEPMPLTDILDRINNVAFRKKHGLSALPGKMPHGSASPQLSDATPDEP